MPTPRHASRAAIDPVETVTPPSFGTVLHFLFYGKAEAGAEGTDGGAHARKKTAMCCGFMGLDRGFELNVIWNTRRQSTEDRAETG